MSPLVFHRYNIKVALTGAAADTEKRSGVFGL